MSSTSIIWIGMDVHKDTVMVAVFADRESAPEVVQQLPNEPRKLRRFFERWAKRGEIRSCYEASGAGYVLYRDITEWGHACEVIAPSLIPVRVKGRMGHPDVRRCRRSAWRLGEPLHGDVGDEKRVGAAVSGSAHLVPPSGGLDGPGR